MIEKVNSNDNIEKKAGIGKNNLPTFLIFLIGISGQLAWSVENSWFNTFIYDEITRDPNPIAWMVAMSAIAATLVTLIMGSVSDRTYFKTGRKPYIAFGYIFWGLITAIFAFNSVFKPVALAVFMVITMDCVMTFFGSTANDAAFNAWIVDITDTSNRGKISAYLSICALLANIVTLALAGTIIETYGYATFFSIIGIFVTITGIISWFMIKENINTQTLAIQTEKTPKPSIWRDLIQAFSIKTIKENKILYLLLTFMATTGIATQVTMPYLFIYIEYYLLINKSLIAVLGAIALIVSAILALIIGNNVHKTNRRNILIIITIIESIFAFSISSITTNENLISLIIVESIFMAMMVGGGVVLNSWMQELYPEDSRGRFQGVRLVFMVLIPMTIGPFIGSWLIQNFGEQGVIDGKEGIIPTPLILVGTGLILLLAIIPLLFIPKKKGIIKIE